MILDDDFESRIKQRNYYLIDLKIFLYKNKMFKKEYLHIILKLSYA